MKKIMMTLVMAVMAVMLAGCSKESKYESQLREAAKLMEEGTKGVIKLNEDDIKKKVEEFKKLKNRELIYYKTDTHWNKAGAYYGYQELFKVLQKEFPRLQCRKPWKVLIEKGHRGDMNVLSPDFVPQDKTHYNCPVPEPPFQKIHNQKIDYDFSNPSGTYSLFLLRDSFSNNLLPFLYSSFNRVRSTWRYALRPGEALQLKQKKVDILILEHVERYLPKAMAQLREKSTDPKAGGK